MVVWMGAILLQGLEVVVRVFGNDLKISSTIDRKELLWS